MLPKSDGEEYNLAIKNQDDIDNALKVLKTHKIMKDSLKSYLAN